MPPDCSPPQKGTHLCSAVTGKDGTVPKGTPWLKYAFSRTSGPGSSACLLWPLRSCTTWGPSLDQRTLYGTQGEKAQWYYCWCCSRSGQRKKAKLNTALCLWKRGIGWIMASIGLQGRGSSHKLRLQHHPLLTQREGTSGWRDNHPVIRNSYLLPRYERISYQQQEKLDLLTIRCNFARRYLEQMGGWCGLLMGVALL